MWHACEVVEDNWLFGLCLFAVYYSMLLVRQRWKKELTYLHHPTSHSLKWRRNFLKSFRFESDQNFQNWEIIHLYYLGHFCTVPALTELVGVIVQRTSHCLCVGPNVQVAPEYLAKFCRLVSNIDGYWHLQTARCFAIQIVNVWRMHVLLR